MLRTQSDGWEWLQRKRPEKGLSRDMPLDLTKQGIIQELPEEDTKSVRPELMKSTEEWNRTAGAWPLKRLVAIWNDLPGGHTGPEVHQPRDCAAQNLAGHARWGRSAAGERERAE